MRKPKFGWSNLIRLGALMVPGIALAANPQAVSVTPSFGTGSSQTFSFTFSDTGGWQALTVTDVLINNFLDGRAACYFAFVPSGPSSGSMYLVDDAGDAGGPFQTLTLPGSSVAQNSQCQLNGSGSSVTSSGSSVTVTVNVAFFSGFGGNKAVYMSGGDNTGNSGWQALGVWGVLPVPSGSPLPVGVSPPHGGGSAQMQFTFSDSGGWQSISVTDVLINNFLDGRAACYFAFVPSGPSSGSIYLVDDAGDAGGPFQSFAIPGTGSAQNSQCSLSASGSSVSAGGTTLTLNVNVSFSSAFGGNKITYMADGDVSGSNSGWLALGTWSVAGSGFSGGYVSVSG